MPEFENYMDLLFAGEPVSNPDTLESYDPQFEQRMSLIQDAMAVNGNMSANPDLFPTLYDNMLLDLIDSITLE